jgi:3,4-dihydroxy 2-butanone 4-phosphate synthase/GTP cyclohydrolase II
MRAYEQTTTQQIHIALTTGDWEIGEPILTRINSTRISDDILGLLTTGIDRRLEDIFTVINSEGKGAVLFIQHRQAAENLLSRLEQLTQIQKEGVLDKAPPLPMDERDFGIGAQILHDLNINKLKVMTNSTQKPRIGLTGYGLEISSYVNY